MDFPIKTKTACRLKWAWSTVYLNSGTTASCHRASHSKLSKENFSSFHNTPSKLDARQKMLNGEWPGNGCEYCRDIEQIGGQSDRQFQLEVPDIYPKELDYDNKLTHVNPSVLEVFFDNTCNFKCVYCRSDLSSSIQTEEKKWGFPIVLEQNIATQNFYKDLVPLFWNWMNQHGHTLQRIQILGGEPFFQQDFFKLIEYFETNPNPNLEFNIVTNLHVPKNKFLDINKKLVRLLDTKSVGRIDIQISVDSWGPAQEYVRHGFDRKIFEKNLEIFLQHKKFRLGLLSTINSLTINEMPLLLEKFKEWNQQQTIYWYMHLVLPHDSSPFSPMIFDYTIFQKSLEQMAQSLPQLSWDDIETFKIFSGIDKKIKSLSKQNKEKQKRLVEILDEIDRRRSLNWRETFPWLELEVSNVVQ